MREKLVILSLQCLQAFVMASIFSLQTSFQGFSQFAQSTEFLGFTNIGVAMPNLNLEYAHVCLPAVALSLYKAALFY